MLLANTKTYGAAINNTDEKMTKIARGWKTPEQLPAKHIRLFAPWILEHVIENLDLYQQAFDQESFGLLLKIHDVMYDSVSNMPKDLSGTQLMNSCSTLLRDDEIAQKVLMVYLRTCTVDTFVKNHVFFAPPDVISPEALEVYFEKFLYNPKCKDMIDRLLLLLPIDDLMRHFECETEITYREFADKIKTRSSKTQLDLWKNRAELLISLITAKPKKRKPEHWYFEFLKACSYRPTSRAFAYFMEGPQFRDIIDDYDIELQKLLEPRSHLNVEFVDEDTPTEPRPQSLFGKRPRHITGAFSSNYELRSYQSELAAKAKHGMNTVICAPTGSGKTHVALDIIVAHLRAKKISQEVGRVVMFVPTIPLVNQQHNHLKINTTPEFFVEKMSGAEKISSSKDPHDAEAVLLADIIVMTPQIFVNMLTTPLKHQKLYLIDFTMLVFDECHHCDSQHPYNIVMNFVHKSNIKIQVVGLTASIGDGSTNKSLVTAEDTMDHMLGLCARLNADTVTSVRDPDNLKQMYNHISQPEDEVYTLRPAVVDSFAHQIALITDYIQDELKKELVTDLTELPQLKVDHCDLAIEGAANKNGTVKTTAQYNGKLAFLKHNIEHKYSGNNARRCFLLKCIELLQICHFTLKSNELMPAYFAFDYMKNRLEDFKKVGLYDQGAADSMGIYLPKIQQIFEYLERHIRVAENDIPPSNTKPILEKLIQCIIDQYKRDKTSRILIFVESRKGCTQLADFLSKHPYIGATFGEASVNHIVSANQATTNFGQTFGTQKEILRLFRQGRINILVATAVAEEGIDVASCNLVIKYNNVGSEKAYIQRRGRARAKDSRSILLALSDSVEQQEFKNVLREHRMKLCLSALQGMSENELKTKIHQKKDEILALIKVEELRLENLRQERRDKIFRLNCKVCGRIICKSIEVARLFEAYYICCNPCAWKETNIVPRHAKAYQASRSIATLCGEWRCNCGQKRGEVVKYGEAYLPTISSDSFLLYKLENGEYKLQDFNQTITWKKIILNYFCVGPITSCQIKEMVTSLYDYSPDAYADVQCSEKKGLSEALKSFDRSRRSDQLKLTDDT